MSTNKNSLIDHPMYPTLHQGFTDIGSAINRYGILDAGGSIDQAALDRSGVGAGPVDVAKTMRKWCKHFEGIPGSGIRFAEFDQLIERWNQATQQGE